MRLWNHCLAVDLKPLAPFLHDSELNLVYVQRHSTVVRVREPNTATFNFNEISD